MITNRSTRKIRVDENGDTIPEVRRIVLSRVVGFSPELGVLVYEIPVTGERYAVYLRTGAKIPVSGFDKRTWTVDKSGLQKEVILARYEFVDPPPSAQDGHADECNCCQCKKRREALVYVDDFGQPGD